MKVRVEIGNATEYQDWERAEKSMWIELGVKDSDILRNEIDRYFNFEDRIRHVVSPEKYSRTENYIVLNNDGAFDIDEDENIFVLNDYLCTFDLNGIDENIFVASCRCHDSDFYEAMNAVKNQQYAIYNVSTENRRLALDEIARMKLNDDESLGHFDYEKFAAELEEEKKILQIPNQKRTFIEFL